MILKFVKDSGRQNGKQKKMQNQFWSPRASHMPCRCRSFVYT